MEDFHTKHELPITLRNVMLHGSYSWGGQISQELTMLASAEYFGFEIKHRKTGKALAWEDHLSPLCNRMAEALAEEGHDMQVFWSMLAAESVYWLIDKGKLKKAKRPFRPKHQRLPP